MAQVSKAKRPTFKVKGKTYLADPDLDEFIREAGISAASRSRMSLSLRRYGIEDPIQLYSLTRDELYEFNQITRTSALLIFDHCMRIKRKGGYLNTIDELEKMQSRYQYLPTGSSSLDRMLSYPNENVGWRTSSVVELYGPPSTGKTQICLTAAALCMRPVDKGGWGRGVAYIDTEGSFDAGRFVQICKFWKVDDKVLKKQFFYGQADSFDELERVIDEISARDIGMVIVDNLISPLSTQYPVSRELLRNMVPRDEHLKRVMNKMRILAYHRNAICIYSNQVEEIIGSYGDPTGPQGGFPLGYSSNIRIKLIKATKPDHSAVGLDKRRIADMDIKLVKARIMNCAYLAETEGYFVLGPVGMSDPENIDDLMEYSFK